jgi:hypothetical protein
MLLSLFANAAPVKPGNAAPFGLELGKATIADVKKLAPSYDDVGTNDYSKGPQWETDGREIDIEGLILPRHSRTQPDA